MQSWPRTYMYIRAKRERGQREFFEVQKIKNWGKCKQSENSTVSFL